MKSDRAKRKHPKRMKTVPSPLVSKNASLIAVAIEFWGDCWRARGRDYGWARLPDSYDPHRNASREGEDKKGHDPGDAIETAADGRGKDGGAVGTDEGREDKVVVVTALHGSGEFVAHLVGAGAADVIALEQELRTTAGAHHLVADVVEAGFVVAGAREKRDGQAEDEQLEKAGVHASSSPTHISAVRK
jgi:hypothetical protein